EGLVPAGWYPAAVVPVEGGRRVAVVNLKGLGSRHLPEGARGYRARDFLGSVNFVDAGVFQGAALADATRQVAAANGWDRLLGTVGPNGASPVPVPERPGQRSVFKHVLYVIKENRTYDQVFGDMTEGNGDARLLEFGEEVTPNHHAVARAFGLLDNFYCSGAVSADGHQWTDEA